MRFTDERKWFHEKRFGMFVHWGVYAVAGVHEQIWWRYGMAASEYAKLPPQFHPRAFDPEQWLDLAQEAGMEYLVFTTKHHDGFCLWDTAETDWNVMHTPYGKDIVGMLAEACHRRNFPLELYYSCVDWHHPAYPNQGRHHEIQTDPTRHNMEEYVAFVKRQIRELCTNYGTIHGIWWDMNVDRVREPSMREMIRELQPCAIFNNRGYDEGDYTTPEREFDPEHASPESHNAFEKPTEACQSVMVNSWGYRRGDDLHYPSYLIRSLDSNLARQGNYLLNVGPDADGRIPGEQASILRTVGNWLRPVRQAFPMTGVPVALEDPRLIALRDGEHLYVHCPFGLNADFVSLAPLCNKARSATLLNTGDALRFSNEEVPYHIGQGHFLRIQGIPEVPSPVLDIILEP